MTSENLSKLYGQRVFRIPDYQRGYAWHEKQLSEMWDDIDEITVNGDGEFMKHYTGTIYLEETKPTEEEKWLPGHTFYNVVDGQQRLTTISILLFELINITDIGYCEESKEDLIKKFLYRANLSGAGKIYKFSYSKSDKNLSYYLNTIMEDKGIIPIIDHQNLYTRNLSYAKEYFRKLIKPLTHDQRDAMFRKITTSLQFDIRAIEKDLDVQAVFETMNNRGKPLTTLEKLKNRLIFLTERLGGEPENRIILRNNINFAWGEIYRFLAKNPDQILDEDIFLSAHLSLYRKPKEATFSEHNAEEKVFQMFCNKSDKYYFNHLEDAGDKEDPVSYNKINNYILSLSKMAPIWHEIHNSKLAIIKKILILNSSKELKIFVASVLIAVKDRNQSEEIFANTEKILFKNRVPGIWIMDERIIANWARELYNNDTTLDEILQKTQLTIGTRVSRENIVWSFQNLFTYVRGQKGFHRWPYLKYFIFEYEEKLKEQFHEDDDKVTIDDYDETTIEHIIPQKYDTYWQAEVNEIIKDLEGEQIDRAKSVLINTLGNLTILKGGKNSSLGNKSWDDKQTRFKTGSYNEIDISLNKKWNKESIMTRGIVMLKFLEGKLECPEFTDDERKMILFCDEYIIKNAEFIMND